MDLQNGFAITITWPDFKGKQAGSWYDPLMRILRINKNFHYKVGHASIILINSEGNCFYFDCGRYEAPYQKGRIRDNSTDCGLNIKTRAVLQNGKISNIEKLLTEIQLNKTCKGFGTLKAAYCTINFESAYSNAKCVQKKGIVPFGPFIRPGTNCCRFIQQIIIKGKPIMKYKWKLKILFPLLPRPLTIIKILPNNINLPEREKIEGYKFVSHFFKDLINTQHCYDKTNVKTTLKEPLKSNNIPSDSHWLSGEMSGSWFHLSQFENSYFITRFSENGIEECSGNFRLKSKNKFEIDKPYFFSYLSHCSKSTIIQDKEIFEFIRL